MTKRSKRGTKPTVPAPPVDAPTQRPTPVPVPERPGYAPGRPTRKPKTDTIVIPDPDSKSE